MSTRQVNRNEVSELFFCLMPACFFSFNSAFRSGSKEVCARACCVYQRAYVCVYECARMSVRDTVFTKCTDVFE